MPTSIDIYNNDTIDLLHKINPSSILDVGPGFGRIGSLIRAHKPDCTVDAVECDQSYITSFQLDKIYNNIYNFDIKDFCLKNPRIRYDLVMFNDILEHLFRSDALDVLDFMLYRSKYILVQWPNNYLQDDWENHESEVHRSNFTIQDFVNHNFEILKYRKKHYSEFKISINYCVLNGYNNTTDIDI